MKRVIEYSSENHIGQSVRQLLKDNGYSRHLLTFLKKHEASVMLSSCGNISPVYLNHILKQGEIVIVSINEDASSKNIAPVNIPIDIVYEDEDIIIINKPSDMPIHPSINNHDNTLANALSYYFKEKGEDFIYRCITRLDRDTTGLTLIAKNPLSAALLSGNPSSINKTYLAICDGIPDKKGSIDVPIARKCDSAIERIADYGGEEAHTEYELLSTISLNTDGKALSYSLVKINLLTGRTHQIRVHFKYIGHPLPGDFLYNPDYKIINRQALHCACLSITHPISHKEMTFTSPLPKDMSKYFNQNTLPGV